MTTKKFIIFLSLSLVILFSNCNAARTENSKNNTNASGEVIALTSETFKQKVFDFEKNKILQFEGDLPVIVDFYATWCGRCRQLSPRLAEIAKEYDGKIIVYKVDTEAEQLLSQSLGITSLPTLLFIPAKGQPQATMDALPKETNVKAINEVLLVQ